MAAGFLVAAARFAPPGGGPARARPGGRDGDRARAGARPSWPTTLGLIWLLQIGQSGVSAKARTAGPRLAGRGGLDGDPGGRERLRPLRLRTGAAGDAAAVGLVDAYGWLG